MPWNGSGTFSLTEPPITYQQTPISSADMNSKHADFVAGLNNTVPRDGQAAMTGNLPMGTNKVTGLGAATVLTDAARADQVQNGSFTWCGTATGTANALVLSPAPAIAAYAAGQEFRFIAAAANTSTSVTVNISAVGAQSISGLTIGQIQAGKIYSITYTGTAFVLVTVDASSLRLAAWRSPYDYGATLGNETSVDNSAAWNALMDACEASWDGTNEGYAIMPTGMGQRWRVDTGTRLIDCQNPGMIIRDATLVVKGAGNIGLDLFGSNNVTVYNVTVVGDRTTPPDIGIAYGRNDSGAVAPNIKLINCRTRGKFNKFGRLRIASEVSTEIGCQWMNWSRSLTAFCDGCVDHMQPLADHVGGVTSPNTTLRTTAQAAMSNTTHHSYNTFSLRQADFSLTVTGVTKANPAVVTYSSGTLASAGLSNGDKIVFSQVPTGSMSELTTLGPFTVANLNEGADTLELSGVDSTGWSGSFVQATCQNQTGPVSLYAGCAGLYRDFHYSLCYGNVHHVIDMATGQGIFDFQISALHERDPQSVVKFVSGSTNRLIPGFRLRCLNYNQTIVDSVIDNSSGSAVLNFDNGYIHIPNMEADPANGIWKDPSKVVIRENFEEIVARETALNATSGFSSYFGRRYAGNATRRFLDYTSGDHYGDPRFVADIDNFRAVHAYRNSDTASPGPFFDAIRESASPAVSDSIGGFRSLGKNDAGEDVWYAGIGATILDATDGSEDGRLALQAMVAGTITTVGWAQTAGLYSRGHLTQTMQTALTADLDDVGNAVNTTYKFAGKQVFNTDTGKPVYATGSAAADAWNDATGTTAHSPS